MSELQPVLMPSVQSPSQPLNPLTLPLSGLQLIEASAGTGKTWTLAALYVRLVLGHTPASNQPGAGLYPPQILVMTFTDAATAELRARIRARLAQAAKYFQKGDDTQADDFLRTLRAELDPAAWLACAARLDLAAQWMDEAAIFTIHGWSSRMLKTHAFDSASLFTQTRVEDSEQLKLTAVQDYWRTWFYRLDADNLAALDGVADTPQTLLGKLKDRWRVAERAPAADAPTLTAPDVALAEWSRWLQQRQALEAPARAAWTDEVVAQLREVVAGKILKGYASNHLPGWLEKMAAWAQGDEIALDVLERFTCSYVVSKGWTQAANFPAFDALQTLYDCLAQAPDIAEMLLSHAAVAVSAAYQRAKQQAAQFDFSDLLQNLYRALQAPDGRLAQAIGTQYPVALVDEFQDTDPWQFGSLIKIYSGSRLIDGGLIMIGDPKQAIYSFRGADLATYLQARNQAQGIYTLAGNFRAIQGLVGAVNHVFKSANAPFGDVPFAPVVACNPGIKPLQVAGQSQVAMTVWHLPYDKTPSKGDFMADMSAVFATQMVSLLQSSAAQPGDMAVLVRDRFEAAKIRDALAARGVRSVYLSERDSVFASAQAQDLWRVLRAVAKPGDTRLLRAALLTHLWGLSWPELDAMMSIEAAWDAQVEQFLQWQQIWRNQGVLPMLHRLLHDQALAQRLLQQGAPGERALTNVLHLGELLQAASTSLQGEGALLRHLEAQLRRPSASAETAPLRLESDAHLVQVVTLHKSKGLEYPLVFLPFMSNYRAEKKSSGRDDAERLAEDIRLFYVAVTRAQCALWLGVAQVSGDVDGKKPVPKSALSVLLGRSAPDDQAQRLATWAGPDILVQTAPQAADVMFEPVSTTVEPQGARVAKRVLRRNWWSASFSALTRDLDAASAQATSLGSERDDLVTDAQLDSTEIDVLSPDDATATELFVPDLTFNAFPAGASYGTLLHDLLQWQAEHGWLAAHVAPDDGSCAWATQLARACQRAGLDGAQGGLLAAWVSQIIKANWPLALIKHARAAINLREMTLGELKTPDYWPEMGFTLPVKRLQSVWLDQKISQAVWPDLPRTALQARLLEGLLTGFMDLVFQAHGRYYVLDYKSNRLPNYAPATLKAAMLDHRYDVQAVLYVLALDRLLKSRLPDYDFDQHMGGALYWFVRGVDQPGIGMLALNPSRGLIEALDAALAGEPS
ncbi:MAG: exodeoxyribonuclease V subunit beta [Rhodoferax sp.]|uniref:exodeoxyribonuclease V subunit beta n=1 Tax=Rhodoferax sp. TaxID=50421 RepID=UPI0026351C93|nr:exodeoxyribonuclease V subunit beta [Rhodoferax sp.]MDD2881355.1 exodeoxyribonuclease V subunit beta [Rhodoferax sp.]